MNGNSKIQPMKALLAYDGSEHADAALEFLCNLHPLASLSVHVMAVITPRQISENERVQAGLERAAAQLTDCGYQATTDLLLGYPAEKITEIAEEINPTLIVLGAKGLRATLGILLGGVAQQVVEYANWPVIVVRAPYKGIKRVLLVTDGSPHSEGAAKFIATFPLPKDAEIHVVHVLPPILTPEDIAKTWPSDISPLTPVPRLQIQPSEATRLDDEQEGHKILTRTISLLGGYQEIAQPALLRGDAATEIIDYAKRRRFELIVAGSRGLSPVKSWLLGSVSRKLIHYSGCSVLVVKTKQQA